MGKVKYRRAEERISKLTAQLEFLDLNKGPFPDFPWCPEEEFEDMEDVQLSVRLDLKRAGSSIQDHTRAMKAERLLLRLGIRL